MLKKQTPYNCFSEPKGVSMVQAWVKDKVAVPFLISKQQLVRVKRNIWKHQERGSARTKKGASKNYPKRCRQISHMAIFPNVACAAMCKKTTVIPANLDDVILNIHVTNIYKYTHITYIIYNTVYYRNSIYEVRSESLILRKNIGSTPESPIKVHGFVIICMA